MEKGQLFKYFTERYLNRKDVMFRLPPDIKINNFWPELTEYRKSKGKEVPLLDQGDSKFWFYPIPYINNLNLIDEYAKITVANYVLGDFSARIQTLEKSLIVDALIDEAFNSSVIEGAFSTKKRTREMVQKNVKPINISEQMIYNNYKALEYILENLDNLISEDTILEIYNIITYNTLEAEDIVEKYRNDSVIVWDYANQYEVYEGPDFKVVPKMMEDLLDFIHTDKNLHPIEKASILHFYFVYVHPFFDGNGRTARAISYMYLLQQGYDFFKFFSISTVIREQKNKYYKAIKDVEDYESDLTYFIEFNVKMILLSISNVLKRLGKEYGKQLLFNYLENKDIILSLRQKKCLTYFIKSEKKHITIEEYLKKYKVSYETARKDLNFLMSVGLFNKEKVGKKFVYKFVGLHKLGIDQFAVYKEY